MRRVIASLAMVLAVALVLWWWLDGTGATGATGAARSPATKTGRAQPVATVTVMTMIAGPVSREVKVPGTARASRAVILFTEVEGRVEKIHFKEAQVVNAGDALVTLDSRDARAELEKARLAYQKALSDYQSAYRESVHSASSSSPALAALKRASEAALAVMESSRATLDSHDIRAPFDGVLGLRQIQPGEPLAAGSAIISLDSIRNLEIFFQLPRQYRPALRPGLPARITSDRQPGEIFAATLAWVGPSGIADGSLKVKARLDNADGRLRPGETLQVALLLEQTTVLMVPALAVVSEDEGHSVFTVIKDLAQRRAVSLGAPYQGWVEIIAGLKQGDSVIVSGHDRLDSGMPVRVIGHQAGFVPAPSPPEQRT